MKKILITILAALLFSSVLCSAQQRAIFPTREGATLTMEYVDDKGELVCTHSMTIRNLKGDLTNGTVDMVYVFTDDKGKPFFNSPNEYVMSISRENGNTVSDMDALNKTLKIQQYLPAGDASSIPVELSIGQKIPDSVIQVKVGVLDVTMKTEDRTVKDHKTIKVKAGSFDAWLIRETVTTKSPFGTEVIIADTWYSEGYSAVSQTIYNSKGKLVGRQELISAK